MKIFTLRNSKEALVAAVAALSLVSAVATVSLMPRMALAADAVDNRRLEQMAAGQACVNRAIASSVGAVGNVQLTTMFMAHINGSSKPVMVASLR